MQFHSVNLESFEEKCVKITEKHILVYHSGEITNIDEDVTFCSQNPQFMMVHQSVTFLEL